MCWSRKTSQTCKRRELKTRAEKGCPVSLYLYLHASTSVLYPSLASALSPLLLFLTHLPPPATIPPPPCSHSLHPSIPFSTRLNRRERVQSPAGSDTKRKSFRIFSGVITGPPLLQPRRPCQLVLFSLFTSYLSVIGCSARRHSSRVLGASAPRASELHINLSSRQSN